MSRTHVVVIPTSLQDLDTLRAAVAAVDAQSLPVSEVIVVCAGPEPRLDARVVRAPRPGTATQRNVGWDLGTADIVHFVDDDVLLEPGYVEAVDALYALPGVVGVAGNLDHGPATTIVPPSPRRRPWRRTEPGQVSRAGVAEPIDRTRGDHDVAWMPAAAMSLDRRAAGGLRFDEVLERGPTGPYALHEDVDLTMRLARRGRLRFGADARARHVGSASDRLSSPEYWQMRTLTRRYLAGKHELGLSARHARAELGVDLARVSYLVVTGRARPACIVEAGRGIVGPGLERR